MKYLFMIFKIMTLRRMRRRHEAEFRAWIETGARSYNESDISYCEQRAAYHRSEIVKIDNIIKLMA